VTFLSVERAKIVRMVSNAFRRSVPR